MAPGTISRRGNSATSPGRQKARGDGVLKRTKPSVGISKSRKKALQGRKMNDMQLEEMLMPDKLFPDGSGNDALNHLVDWAFDEELAASSNQDPSVDSMAEIQQQSIDLALKRCSNKMVSNSSTDEHFCLDGITTPLTPLQFATLGWMVGRESTKSSVFGKGGIVAHNMGLGKTLIALALMVVNKACLERHRENDGPTLVVVPNESIIIHWQQECVKHANALIPESVTTSFKKFRHAKDTRIFHGYKVVFATYGDILHTHSQSPQKPGGADASPDSGATDATDSNESAENVTQGPSRPVDNDAEHVLFRTIWYRVILDEAHTIKNPHSRTSIAVRRLKKRVGWAVSGTPLVNSTNELFSYFNFLDIKGCNKLSTYKSEYFSGATATDGLRKALGTVMRRQQIGKNFLGRLVISLPSQHVSTTSLNLSAEEKIIQKFILSKIKEEGKKSYKLSIESGEHGSKARARVKGLLLRLWQLYRFAGIHLFLLEKGFLDIFEIEGVEKLVKKLEKVKEATDVNVNSHPHAAATSITTILKLALNTKRLEDQNCIKCKEPCLETQCSIHKLPCGHFECETCLVKKMKSKEGAFKCRAKQCSQMYKLSDAKSCPTVEFPLSDASEEASDSESSDDDEPGQPQVNSRQLRKRPTARSPKPTLGKDALGVELALDPDKSRFLACGDEFLRQPEPKAIVPSAKIAHVLSLLKEWQKSSPDDKIIVFTQFMVVASLIGRIARSEDIKFVYYTGTLSTTARKAALGAFEKDASVKLLIASLQAGGQSLNITSANRIILMELWWNSPVEKQAFARVYRMGQKKDVHVVRLQCSGTREDDVLTMQYSKEEQIASCMLSKELDKPKTKTHPIFSIIGTPVVDKSGTMIAVKKPEQDGDSSDESDDDAEDSDDPAGNFNDASKSDDTEERLTDAGAECTNGADAEYVDGKSAENNDDIIMEDAEDTEEMEGSEDDAEDYGTDLDDEYVDDTAEESDDDAMSIDEVVDGENAVRDDLDGLTAEGDDCIAV